MKLLDRSLLWALSVLAAVLSLLALLLVLFPTLGWMQVSWMRIAVGVLAALCLLVAVAIHFRRAFRKNAGEAALVDENENGSAFVTLQVIDDMARRIVQEAGGVRSCRCTATNSAGGVDVALELALLPGVAIAPLALLLQQRLKVRIFEMTGIPVEKVSILVEAAEEGKPPRQAIVPQLPDHVR